MNAEERSQLNQAERRAQDDRDNAITMCHYYYQHEFSPSTFQFGLKPMAHFVPESVPGKEVVSELLRRHPRHERFRSEIQKSFGETVKVNPNKWRNRQAA